MESIFSSPREAQKSLEPPNLAGCWCFPTSALVPTLQIDVLTAAETGLRLVECNLNARNFRMAALRRSRELARQIPALSVEYGEFAQLEATLEDSASASDREAIYGSRTASVYGGFCQTRASGADLGSNQDLSNSIGDTT